MQATTSLTRQRKRQKAAVASSSSSSSSSRRRQRKAPPKIDSDTSSRLTISSLFFSLAASPLVGSLALIFGGCCSNVFALEAIVKDQPTSGTLITFIQFLFVASEGFLHFFRPASKNAGPLGLIKSTVPTKEWMIPIVLFFSVSVLTNYVWTFQISVPVHIIVRSGGTVITMILGCMLGRKYSARQILGVLTLTAGVVLATLHGSNEASKKAALSNTNGGCTGAACAAGATDPANATASAAPPMAGLSSSPSSLLSSASSFYIGMSLLLFCAILGSLQGLAAEKIYSKYGNQWREWLFYSHALSLPFFIPVMGGMKAEFLEILNATPRFEVPLANGLFHLSVSHRLCYLVANALTQYTCVRGVNWLAGSVSALAVTVVLTVRKCVSMVISVYVFGNPLSANMVLSSILVFVGAFVYAMK